MFESGILREPLKEKVEKDTSAKIKLWNDKTIPAAYPANIPSKYPVTEYSPMSLNQVRSSSAKEKIEELNRLSLEADNDKKKYDETLKKSENDITGIHRAFAESYRERYNKSAREYNDYYNANIDEIKTYNTLVERYIANIKLARNPEEIKADIENTNSKYTKEYNDVIGPLNEEIGKYAIQTNNLSADLDNPESFNLAKENDKKQKEAEQKKKAEEERISKSKEQDITRLNKELSDYYEALRYNDDFEKNSKSYEKFYEYRDDLSDDNLLLFLENAKDEEKGLAYYIANTSGEKELNSYLDFMQDTMTRREAGEKVEFNSKLPPVIKQIHQGAIALDAGLDDFSQGIAGVGNAVKTTFTGKTYDTPSATPTQYASDTFFQNASGIGKIALSGVRSIGNMAVPIATTVLTGGAAGSVLFGTSAAGNGYNEKIKEGWGHGEATAYGVISGISEVFLERMLGGITKLGGGKVLSSVDDWIKGIKKGVTRATLTMAKKGMSEFTEEGLQTFLEPIYASIISGEEYTPAELEEIVFSGLVGLFTVGPLESGSFLKEATTYKPSTVEDIISKGEKAEEGTVERLVAEEIKDRLAKDPEYALTAFDYARIQKYYKRKAKNPSTLPSDKYEKTASAQTETKNYMSMEDFANNESPVWRNVDYEDDATKASITQETHNKMVEEGAVVKVSADVQTKVEESFPDLREVKKKERTPILKESMKKLKTSLRQLLSSFNNQTFDFEVNGKILEAKLYNTGINEVLEKITKQKANMLYTTESIFTNARYLYSTPDYNSDPNIYRWNYFYTPVQIGDDIVGVRIAVRDMGRGIGMTPESQIYNWGIKKETSLDGVRRGPKVASYGVSSEASSETSLDDVGGGTSNRISNGVSSDVSNNTIPQTLPEVNSEAQGEDSDTASEPEAETLPLPENSRDGNKIYYDENDPEYLEKVKNAKDEIERSGIRYGASEATINFIKKVAKAFKVNVLFYAEADKKSSEGKIYSRGAKYNRATNTIYINMASSESYIPVLFAHELIHSIEGTKMYNILYSYTLRGITRKGSSFDDAVEEKIKEYREGGEIIGEEEAKKEVVAEYVSNNLLDNEEAINYLLRESAGIKETVLLIIEKLLSFMGVDNVFIKDRLALEKARQRWKEEGRTKSTTVRTDFVKLRNELTEGNISEEEFNEEIEHLDDVASAEGMNLYDIISEIDSEDNVQSALIGKTKDGRRVYETDFPDNVSQKERIALFKKRIATVFNLGGVELKTDVKKIIVKGDKFTKKKNLFGGKVVTDSEYQARINALYDIADILATSKYLPDKSGVEPSYANPEIQPKNNAHKDVKYWYKFQNEIVLDGVPYTVTFSIRDKGREQYQYLIDFKENKTLGYSPTVHKKDADLRLATQVSDNRITHSAQKVNTQNNGNEQSALLKKKEQKKEDTSPKGDKIPVIKRFTTEVRNAFEKEENYLVAGAMAIYDIPTGKKEEVRKIVRELTSEYIYKGTKAPETINSCIEALLELSKDKKNNSSFENSSKFTRKWELSVDRTLKYTRNSFLKASHQVEREVSAAEHKEEGTAKNEKIDFPPQELMELMEQRKKESRQRNVVRALTPLSNEEEKQVRNLLDGSMTLDQIDKNKYDYDSIKKVYEASIEYNRLNKLIKERRRWIRENPTKVAEAILSKIDRDMLETGNGLVDHKSQGLYMINTLRRNIEYITKNLSPEIQKEMIEIYVDPITHATAEATRFKEELRNKIRKLGLSRTVHKGDVVSEAFAVQFLGEAQYAIRTFKNNKSKKRHNGHTLEEWETFVKELWEANPTLAKKENKEKIENAVKVFREIYDKLFEKMNEVRVLNGYDPISYRSGYFPHFGAKESDGVLALFGKALGIKTEFDTLPGNINGITDTFRPGIQWFANAQERLGNETIYDAVEGFDRYIDGAADVIFHTENIQRIRGLVRQIRYRDSDAGIKKQEEELRGNMELTEDQLDAALEQLHKNGKYSLSNFVANLDEYANLLANKKSQLDRSTEAILSRSFYSFMRKMSSKVSANMVISFGVALSNLIPLIMAPTQINARFLIPALGSAFINELKRPDKRDGFEEASDFLTSRRGSSELVKEWQRTRYKGEEGKKSTKIKQSFLGTAYYAIDSATDAQADFLSKFTEFVDMFVANVIVRAKYAENTYESSRHKALDPVTAMRSADKLASGIMADRSKGALPTVFGAVSPIVKMFTQFQIEVANQYGYLFHDLPKEKEKFALAWALLKYFTLAWLFNELYEKCTGRRPAFDIWGLVEEGISDGVGSAIVSATEQLPFTTVLALFSEDYEGARVPVANAIPSFASIKDSFNEDVSFKKKAQVLAKELSKPLTYLALPGGGGQITKTAKGVTSLAQGGRYTLENDGDKILQYPVDNTKFSDIARATLFGPSATKGGQSWIKSNFDSLSARETVAYENAVEAGGDRNEVYEFIRSLTKVERSEKQKEYEISDKQLKTEKLVSSDFEDEVKWAIYEELIATESDIEHAHLAEEYDISADFFYESLAEYELLDKEYKEDMMNGINRTYTKLMRANDIVKHTNLAQKQKAVLWQLLVETNAKNNPYNKRIANEVYDILYPKKTS